MSPPHSYYNCVYQAQIPVCTEKNVPLDRHTSRYNGGSYSTSSSSPPAGSEKPKDQCEAGFYCKEGSPLPNPSCTENCETGGVCPAGFMCKKGTSVPVSCTMGYYCRQGNNGTHDGPCDAGTAAKLISFLVIEKFSSPLLSFSHSFTQTHDFNATLATASMNSPSQDTTALRRAQRPLSVTVDRATSVHPAQGTPRPVPRAPTPTKPWSCEGR